VSTDQPFYEVMRVPSRRERKAKERAQRDCKHEWQWHATGAGMGHHCTKCDAPNATGQGRRQPYPAPDCSQGGTL